MRRTILIVEDAPTLRAQLSTVLGSDYDCLVASDGAEALQMIEGCLGGQQRLPDAIVTDLEMPVVGGIELLKRIKEDPATNHIPVVITTTVTVVEAVNECRRLGCSGFVLKPIQPDYLKAKLRQLLKPLGDAFDSPTG